MRNILFLLLILVPVQAFGFECVPAPLLYYYQQSDFVAIVKVVEVTPGHEHQQLKIEIVELYKGKEVPSIRVNTASKFYVAGGSTWLVFARKEKNGVPVFGSCSGSKQIDRVFDSVQYPNDANNYKRRIDLKLAVLSFLKNNKLENSNPYDLNLPDVGIYRDTTFQNFENQNRFAVYEVAVNEDLSIEGITTLQAFDNPKLDELLSERLRKHTRIHTSRKELPTKTKFVVIFYYYPAEKKDPSFVGDYDV